MWYYRSWGFAVTRKTKRGSVIDENEAFSVLDVLKIYTKNGAYTNFEEGKLADLAILLDDSLKVNPEDIGKIEVEMTVIGGEIVFTK